MEIFCTDLDNTIIYSYKHDIGEEKRNVEIYQGREISFITEKTYKLLNAVKEKYLIIPTSTRTIEQYKRIDLGIGDIKYALVCNGGVLLLDGEKDAEWYNNSKKLIESSIPDIEKALEYLKNEKRRKFELRFIEDLFVFTKCCDPEQVVDGLKTYLDSSLVDVFHNGEKVYVVPRNLSKGKAIERLRNYLPNERIVAAGDSEFDISMVEQADFGLVPHGLKDIFHMKDDIFEVAKDRIFSEALLEQCLNYKAGY